MKKLSLITSSPGMCVVAPSLDPSSPFLSFPVYLIITSQVGSLPKNDIDVGTGLVGAPAYVMHSSRIHPVGPRF